MEKTTTQPLQPLTLVLILFLALALSACGSGSPVAGFNGESTNLSSIGDTPGTDTPAASGAKAMCNKIEGAGFRGRTQLFKYNGAFYANTQQVQLDQLPEGYTDSQSLLQFFKWKADGSPSETVSFYLEDRATHMPVSGYIKALSATDIASISQKFYMKQMSPSELIGRVNFVLSEVSSSEWQAVRLAYFQNSALVDDTDFLIPQFAADPNEYAKANPDFLAALHPNASLIGSSGLNNFVGLLHQFCFQ